MTTEAKPEQPSNAEYPMEMTEFGIKTHSNPIQPEKEESPILVSKSGITTEANLLQLKNKLLAMEVKVGNDYGGQAFASPNKPKPMGG